MFGKKERVREKCVFYCLMRWVGVYECTGASTFSWKEEELLPWVPCYSKSQQITPCKQPVALGKHSFFPGGCSAASVQAGTPVILHCPGCQPLVLVLMPPGSPISHFFSPSFSKVPLVPVGRTGLLHWHQCSVVLGALRAAAGMCGHHTLTEK